MKYVSIDGISKNEFLPKDTKPKTNLLPKQQNKKFTQKTKNFLYNITGEGYRTIERTTNCYFYTKKTQICLLIKRIQTHKKHLRLN